MASLVKQKGYYYAQFYDATRHPQRQGNRIKMGVLLGYSLRPLPTYGSLADASLCYQ